MEKKSRRATLFAGTAALVLTFASILAGYLARPSGIGWCVLSLSEAQDDRTVVASLASAGIEGVVSESTQWVYVDDFSGLERVPLDRYRERIETFDPRDDGYADSLRSLFVSEGRRRFYIPDVSPQRFKSISSLFRGSDYSLSVPPRSAVDLSDLVLFAVAFILAVFLGGAHLPIAAAAPAALSLAFFGPAGFAVAALATSSARAVLDPVREAFRSGSGKAKGGDFPWLFDGLPVALLLGAGAAAGVFLGGLPPVAAFLSVAACIAAPVAVVALQERVRAERGHGRFIPVSLLGRFGAAMAASRVAVPFAVAAIASFAIGTAPMVRSGSAAIPTQAAASVTMDQYRAHIDFQRSFSSSRLGSAPSAPYGRYSLGSDGLVSDASVRDYTQDTGKVDLPPAERMLSRATVGSASSKPRAASIPGIVILLAAALAAAFPAFRHALRKGRRAKNIESFADKRIAA